MQKCLICDRGFLFSEEMDFNRSCRGYIHKRCINDQELLIPNNQRLEVNIARPVGVTNVNGMPYYMAVNNQRSNTAAVHRYSQPSTSAATNVGQENRGTNEKFEPMILKINQLMDEKNKMEQRITNLKDQLSEQRNINQFILNALDELKKERASKDMNQDAVPKTSQSCGCSSSNKCYELQRDLTALEIEIENIKALMRRTDEMNATKYKNVLVSLECSKLRHEDALLEVLEREQLSGNHPGGILSKIHRPILKPTPTPCGNCGFLTKEPPGALKPVGNVRTHIIADNLLTNTCPATEENAGTESNIAYLGYRFPMAAIVQKMRSEVSAGVPLDLIARVVPALWAEFVASTVDVALFNDVADHNAAKPIRYDIGIVASLWAFVTVASVDRNRVQIEVNVTEEDVWRILRLRFVIVRYRTDGHYQIVHCPVNGVEVTKKHPMLPVVKNNVAAEYAVTENGLGKDKNKHMTEEDYMSTAMADFENFLHSQTDVFYERSRENV